MKRILLQGPMNKSFWIGILVLLTACAETEGNKKNTKIEDTKGINPSIDSRVSFLLNYPVDSIDFPRRLEGGQIVGVPSKDWTSGFFPGNLFYLYQLTGDDRFKEKAEQWLPFLEKEKWNSKTHDMGFKVNCSFGNANKLRANKTYQDVIIQSAETLITRFDTDVGCIKSWDFGKDQWTFPVIIDNMMNLELLFEATNLSGDSTFYRIAFSHAMTTMKNHFRADNSSYHVIDYDPESGEVVNRLTHQGYNTESVWSRGQAWGFYGFTIAYRYTKNPDFLNQAISIAKFMMEHPDLPKDKIPYWDMSDPQIPNAAHDASAGAIMASASFELFKHTENDIYFQFAESIIHSLSSDDYVLKSDVDAPFILNHSTGNWPKSEAIDVPIVYADYYFLEALIREVELTTK